jgi:hypothetical protein
MEVPKLLSAKEVAHAYGVHPNWVYNLAKRGVLPSKKVGGRRFFPDEVVAIPVEGSGSPSVHERSAVAMVDALREPAALLEEGLPVEPGTTAADRLCHFYRALIATERGNRKT